jgi:hypothetical protein
MAHLLPRWHGALLKRQREEESAGLPALVL